MIITNGSPFEISAIMDKIIINGVVCYDIGKQI